MAKPSIQVGALDPFHRPRPALTNRIFTRNYGTLALIWLLGILARIPFYLALKPTWSADSPGYAIPYFLWRNHRFFLGARTPIYPLFLGLTRWLAGCPVTTTLPLSATYQMISSQAALPVSAAYVTVLLQSALDIAAVCASYHLLARLNVRRSTALAFSLFLVTIPALCLLDLNILTLSLSFSLLILCARMFVALATKVAAGSRFIGTSLLCGLVFSCASLLRPENLIFCSIPMSVLLACWTKSKLRRTAAPYGNRIPLAVFFVVLAAIPPVLAWMTWNYVGVGEFRMTTLTGWNRSKTVYNLFDRVQPEDRVLGQALTASYLRRNRNHKVVRDHVWQGLKDSLWSQYQLLPLEDPTTTPSAFHQRVDRIFENLLGMKDQIPCDFPGQLCTELLRRQIDIGDYVGKVSWKLARNNPGAYLANVAGNFLDTFDFRYLDSEPASEDSHLTAVDGTGYVLSESLARFLPTVIHLFAPLLTLLYVVTFGFVIFSPLVLTTTAHDQSLTDNLVTALALATVGTFLAMCFLSGYNKEYSIPHLGMMVICTAYAVENRSRIRAAIGLGSDSRVSTKQS